MDILDLDQRLKGTYKGMYGRLNSTFGIFSGTSATFRNCIFWQNKDYNGRLTHIDVYGGRVNEMSNCIFEGNPDSSIIWSNDLNPTRPNPLVLLYQNNFDANPLFVNPPTTYGPNGLKPGLDFHLKNTCSQLSPAHNAGMNNALSSWTNIKDYDGNQRIVCDTVDIGPYELAPSYRKVKITQTPANGSHCDNDLQLSINTTCNPNQGYQWQFRENQGWANLNSGNSITYKNTKPNSGAYRVIYTQLDCNISDTSGDIYISLLASPKPFIGRDTTIEQKASLILDAGNYNNYLWQDGSTSRTYTVNGNTQGISQKTYSVRVTGANGCFGYDSIKVNVTWNSSLTSLLSRGWKLYPNPSSGVINIQSPESESFNWQLMDISSSLIQSGDEQSSQNIDLSTLPSGTYLLRIQTLSGAEILRIIKSK